MLKIFSVYDSKANGFMLPFYATTPAVAKRNISRAVLDEETDFSKFPEDYTLFEVGQWDGDSGQIAAHVSPISHGLFTSFARQPNGGMTIADLRGAFGGSK